jgi:hypothetical protein
VAPSETEKRRFGGVPPTPTPYILPTPAGVRLLMIPKLADQFQVPIPIVDLPLVNRQWDVSGLGYYVGWLQGTTWMDAQWGNTVLAAHVQLGPQSGAVLGVGQPNRVTPSPRKGHPAPARGDHRQKVDPGD